MSVWFRSKMGVQSDLNIIEQLISSGRSIGAVERDNSGDGLIFKACKNANVLASYIRQLFSAVEAVCSAQGNGSLKLDPGSFELESWSGFALRLVELFGLKSTSSENSIVTLACISRSNKHVGQCSVAKILQDRWFWPLDPVNAQIFTSPNAFIAKKLQEMASLRSSQGDSWAAKAYTKGAQMIALHPAPIMSGLQARQIRGIGTSISGKINEILDTGTCQDLVDKDLVDVTMTEFEQVWSVGPAVARSWYDKGYRSIADVRHAVAVGSLEVTKNQGIGLEHVEDFLKAIPRQTMTAIGDHIASLIAGSGFQLEIVGSYRRGKQSSKDVDMIVYPSTVDSSCVEFPRMLDKLRLDLTHRLRNSMQLKVLASGQRVLMGAICHEEVWRRVDIFFVKTDELACALLAHTGPAVFNIKLRQEAIQRRMILNEYHLSMANGSIVPTSNEEEVMTTLGFAYLEPSKRT